MELKVLKCILMIEFAQYVQFQYSTVQHNSIEQQNS